MHEESAHLAQQARAAAINAGERLVVDSVLSSRTAADQLGRTLERAGYSVIVVEVEVPLDVSRNRTMVRWEAGYHAAERAETGAELGGLWVPSEFPESLYGDGGPSKCLEVARMLAAGCPAVVRLEEYIVAAEDDGEPRTATVRVRTTMGGMLVANNAAGA